ncbi:unnamed protein product [Darwinula stevensoni]|uniref:Membrane protein BRI3 n=1 Tax=Darwinula stevensoni TaxID=69355 RepID=A0A7R9FS53_9CRUS|nr:unnamed protein product [Darwinula stevensoni]CAG0902612.1 unnamed protein product [Darwinula stevensoni]
MASDKPPPYSATAASNEASFMASAPADEATKAQHPPPYGWTPGSSSHAHPPPTGSYNAGGTYGATDTSYPQAQVIIVGGCPACRVGILYDDFTLLGILMAILFFPMGILCCLALRQKRCSNCGAIYG